MTSNPTLPKKTSNRTRPMTSNPTRLMAFNPALPTDGSLMVAAEMRDQFNGLNVQFGQGLSGTAQNPNMSTLNIPLSDPPTRPEVQQIIDAFNTLLNQITRV